MKLLNFFLIFTIFSCANSMIIQGVKEKNVAELIKNSNNEENLIMVEKDVTTAKVETTKSPKVESTTQTRRTFIPTLSTPSGTVSLLFLSPGHFINAGINIFNSVAERLLPPEV